MGRREYLLNLSCSLRANLVSLLLVHLYRVLARSGLSLKDQLPGETVTLGEALMAPTVIYVKQVIPFLCSE